MTASGPGPELTLTEHLTELRARLLWSAGGFLLTFALGWMWAPGLLTFLMERVGWETVVYLAPTEGLFSILRLAIIIAALLVSPLWAYQAWRFISPGLSRHEQKLIWRILPIGIVLGCSGLLFGYLVVHPVAFRFLIGFGTAQGADATLTVGAYLKFLFGITLPFVLIFQFPIVAWLLTKFGILDVARLRKSRKLVIVGAFAVGAFLTPPDPVSQILMVIPILSLFEVGLFISGRTEVRNPYRDRDLED